MMDKDVETLMEAARLIKHMVNTMREEHAHGPKLKGIAAQRCALLRSAAGHQRRR